MLRFAFLNQYFFFLFKSSHLYHIIQLKLTGFVLSGFRTSVQVNPKARFICFSSSSIACYLPCFPWKCLSFCLKERYTSSEWVQLLMSFVWAGPFIVLKISHFGIYVWEFAVAFLLLFGSKPSLNVLLGLLIF